MSSDSASINLTNHFLIAMPGLSDELFGRSVVFMCEHSERGALGLIINKPSDINLGELFEKVDLPLRRDDLRDSRVFLGGPLQPERGFVLHEPMVGLPEPSQVPDPVAGDDKAEGDSDSIYASTLRISGVLEMTTSRDVLEAMAGGGGPAKVLVSLGYSSWGQGQLESEITENSWLTVEADLGIIFDTPVEQRYEKAMALLGLQPWMLAPGAGRA